ncbi:MAG: hypothetical protein H6740_25610 [Alphaproteobacteria bacterium]|nr:hypothetical protein [Alphaproteobacteria bacterium]
MTRAILASLGLGLCACAQPDFGPPDEPPHNRYEDGVAHARGMETPFLCRSADGALMTCPTNGRPAPQQLSCDAAGCHGGASYSALDAPDTRHLHGSDGPSCWTCHNQEWSTRMEVTVP